MNRKLVVKNNSGDIIYCVLCQEKPYNEQLEEVMGIKPGYGFSVEMTKKSVIVRDYFAGENRGEFDIISFKPTKLPQNLNWKKEET